MLKTPVRQRKETDELYIGLHHIQNIIQYEKTDIIHIHSPLFLQKPQHRPVPPRTGGLRNTDIYIYIDPNLNMLNLKYIVICIIIIIINKKGFLIASSTFTHM